MTRTEDMEFLADLNMEIAVELDRRMMTVREILAITAGSIIPMGRAAGENIDLYIGEARVGFGEIVINETAMGFRITSFRNGD